MLLFPEKMSLPRCLTTVIAAAVEQMGCWSPRPAARRSCLPRVGVAASAHVTGLYRPCGPYRRREVLAVAAGSVQEEGRKRREHALLFQSHSPGPWGPRGQSYLPGRRHLPSRVATYHRLRPQPLAGRSSAPRSVRTVAHPVDGQRARVPLGPISLSLLHSPLADRPNSPATVWTFVACAQRQWCAP